MAKREITTFSLSFLDVMCCGFGAVVLLVILLNVQVLQQREDQLEDQRVEVDKATMLRDFAKEHLEELQRQVSAAELDEARLAARGEELQRKLAAEQAEGDRRQQAADQRATEIEAMRREIAALEAERRQAEAELAAKKSGGQSRVGYDGDGRRQYLTGLKLGGDRTLILVDASASMLSETIVNAVLRSLRPDESRRQAPKWLRATRSVHWLVANLHPKRSFQVYLFNTTARPAVPDSAGRWLSTSDAAMLDAAVAGVRAAAPINGTSLASAFATIAELSPRPDSVILLTDGLPTQGRQPTERTKVSGKQRQALFVEAVRTIPDGVPINTLLFPMEGDPAAAGAFWALAVATGGSVITPARGWP